MIGVVAEIVTPDPEVEADAQPELSRVTVVVGAVEIDVGLLSDVRIATLVDDVIELADTQLAVRPQQPDVGFDTAGGSWTLARVGAEPFDSDRALADFDVCDGEVLVLREVAMACAPTLFDDVDTDIAASRSGASRWHDVPMAGCFVLGVTASTVAALLVARRGSAAGVIAALAVGAAGLVVASVAGHRAARAAASPWLAAVALPLMFAGS